MVKRVEIGTVVMVFQPHDPNEPRGMGRVVGHDPITLLDEYGNILKDEMGIPYEDIMTPRIVMEDGEILTGMDCWWYPA